MKKLLLYLMVLLYFGMGIVHLASPDFFTGITPEWIPFKAPLVMISGIAEILLALLLIPENTRKTAAWLIIAMLAVYFFLIHIPMTVHFYQTGNQALWIAVLRLPLQFILIWWAWIFTKPVSKQTL